MWSHLARSPSLTISNTLYNSSLPERVAEGICKPVFAVQVQSRLSITFLSRKDGHWSQQGDISSHIRASSSVQFRTRYKTFHASWLQMGRAQGAIAVKPMPKELGMDTYLSEDLRQTLAGLEPPKVSK